MLTFVVISLICLTSVQSAFTANPLKDDTAVTISGTSSTSGDVVNPDADAINALKISLDERNKYAGVYKTKSLGFATLRGTAKFYDGKKGETIGRLAWFEKILAEHGCKEESMTDKEIKKSSWLILTKIEIEKSAVFIGRDFVVQAIANHYSGSVETVAAAPAAANISDLANITALENTNVDQEKAILTLEFEVDTLLLELSGLGILDGGKKKTKQARIDEIKTKLIPAMKGTIAANRQAVTKALNDLAAKYEKQGDYDKALAYYNYNDQWDNTTRLGAANCYEKLGDYTAAIDSYKKISPQTEAVQLKIADCHHANKQDKEATADLTGILSNYKNTSEQQQALAKIEEWKLLDNNSTLSKQVADTYIKKAFIDGASSSAAAKDYQKACSIMAKSSGSSAQSISASYVKSYSNAYTQALTNYQQAQTTAGAKFDSERKEAERIMGVKKEEYNDKLAKAPDAYNNEIERRENELRNERATLSSYQNSQSNARDTWADEDDELTREKRRRDDIDDDLDTARSRLRDLESKYDSAHTNTNPPSNPYPTDDDDDDYYPDDDDDDDDSNPYPVDTTNPYSSSPSLSDIEDARQYVRELESDYSTADRRVRSQESVVDSARDTYDSWSTKVTNQSNKITRLNNEYKDLLVINDPKKGKEKFINNYVSAELSAKTKAENTYNVTYDPAKRDSYISSSADVVSTAAIMKDAKSKMDSIQQISKAAGYK